MYDLKSLCLQCKHKDTCPASSENRTAEVIDESHKEPVTKCSLGFEESKCN